MAKSEEEEKPDSLEIVSIGSLYSGPWNKKYWSSSRGKDRYPYPVGYHAAQGHHGSTYQLEISEGLKGPLFMITSPTGDSFSGQTPDIAWNKFQKKGCLVKIWPGKRFSCKIDGSEFFGFKNPLVQRLLRELVANVSGTTEQSLPSSSFCNVTSTDEHDNRCLDACTYPNLLPYSAIPRVTGKRSRKPENMKSKSVTHLKRSRPQEKALPTVDENGVASSGKFRFTSAGNSTSTEEKPLYRSQDINLQEFSSPIAMGNEDGDEPVPKNSPGLCDTMNSAPRIRGQITCNEKLEINEGDIVFSEAQITESHEEVGTSVSNMSSGKGGSDSVDQEMVKLMMTVLLPQAIPLLKKNPKKKKKSATTSESITCRPTSEKGNEKPQYFTDAQPPTIDLGSVVPAFEHAKSVVLDSYEDESRDHVDQLEISFRSANQTSSYNDSHPNTEEHFVSADIKELSICHVETCGNKEIFCNDEVHMTMSERHIKADVLMSDTCSGLLSPKKRCLYEENQDQTVCSNLEENLGDIDIRSEEKELKCTPESTEGNDKNNVNTNCMETSIQSPRKILNVEIGVLEMDRASLTELPSKVYTRKKLRNKDGVTRNFVAPLAASSKRRNFDDGPDLETMESPCAFESHQITSTDKPYTGDILGAEVMLGEQSHSLQVEKTTTDSKALLNNVVLVSHHSKLELPELGTSPSFQKEGTSFSDNSMSVAGEVQASLDLKLDSKLELKNELEGKVDLIGCYLHPLPVTSLLLRTKGNSIYICVLCGLPKDKNRTLFSYELTTRESELGFPSFVGHTSVTLPFSIENSDKAIAHERSVLQFTPDGQCIVLLDSIRTPYCREGKLDCWCSTCSPECFEDNAVKIVQIKAGYVSVVTKLRTVENVQLILACEPSHLIAVGESGRLQIWAMNSTWSTATEEFAIPSNDCFSPSIVELKRIPKCASLVIGHNGFGKFTIWDISKRTSVSRFSTPSASVFQISPICLFSWESKCCFISNPTVEDHIDGIMAATNMCISGHSEGHNFPPADGEDVAVWLLMSTASDSYDHHGFEASNCQTNSVRCWRLALLVKNMVIFGSALDPRTIVIGASAGHGITGTCDGLVYMWELSTGCKLGSLHHFKGGSVSCIATDDSSSNVFAVVSDGGQLLVFHKSQTAVLHS
ncbi:uncharacterized protein LOC120001458 isoform X2 [Tripterygium wilfordii]|uniref:uncharacterized protein LOC120001458 isoform X2 n=1 Tax=Tripterygium wilfordii TaxID=458696 RepID=UPI0018F85FF1|nr:uncharacterized protein LOC120001458 isoform X2 [Tripterygium wilfordii]